MALTKIDKVPALVVIDLQKGIVGLQATRPAGEIVVRTAQLARFPRAAAASCSRPRDGASARAHRWWTSQDFICGGWARTGTRIGTPRGTMTSSASKGRRIYRNIIG